MWNSSLIKELAQKVKGEKICCKVVYVCRREGGRVRLYEHFQLLEEYSIVIANKST